MIETSSCPQIVAAVDAVEAARGMYGDRHPQVAVALTQLAQEYEWLSDWKKAERVLKEALAIEEERTEPHARRIAAVLRRLAGVYEATSRSAAAAELLGRAADMAPEPVEHETPTPSAPPTAPRAMSPSSPQASNPRPVCGTLSVCLPFAAGVLALAYGAWHTTFGNDTLGWSDLVGMMVLLPPAWLASIVLGVCGIRRRERRRWLSVLGLVIGLGPFLLGMLGALLGA